MSIEWQTVLSAIGSVLGVVLIAAVGWAVANFQKWTGIQLSEQQRAVINDAAAAIANALKIMLAQGKVHVADLRLENSYVRTIVNSHMTPTVRDALNARWETLDDLTMKALAKVGEDHGVLMMIGEPPPSTLGESSTCNQ